MGSVLSIAAEFMASDKVKAIENHTVGPTDSAGDELLYSNQLTAHYLPSSSPAPIAVGEIVVAHP